jgi:hypothetical protein
VYGLGRFPVTLYYEQWIGLLEHADELTAFLEENNGKLKLRGGARVILECRYNILHPNVGFCTTGED